VILAIKNAHISPCTRYPNDKLMNVMIYLAPEAQPLLEHQISDLIEFTLISAPKVFFKGVPCFLRLTVCLGCYGFHLSVFLETRFAVLYVLFQSGLTD